jgi:hypothetical protein
MRYREVLFLPTIPTSSFFCDQCILYHFLCLPPSFVNLEARFLLMGEGCNTPCYGFPNHLHEGVNEGSSSLMNPNPKQTSEGSSYF